ncbi:GNAT family N-acetyltransferase [Paenibacillus taiwanensis]|uniref:GNAT family N-acetyltransferase n=1 Tax=Paenibacillus taiwanensis TaxID=401638 RepID=UPI0004076CB4|nr:GNAT family N-acetyltransferase [Paenibacillus taiwanensis]
MHLRVLEERDNPHIETIIRTCLKEFGGDREGLAWADPQLGRLSEVYQMENSKYWVIEHDGKIVGGCGIGPVAEMDDVGELQKMYCLPEARGTGIAHELMVTALDFASKHYSKCYIETLSNMEAANQFYKKYGFVALDKPLGNTGHFSCDVWYLKTLTDIG